jgi:hypothetical protein
VIGTDGDDADAVETTADVDQDARQQLLQNLGARDFLCLGPILARSIYYYAGIPLGTALQFTRPLYAELLRGSTISLIIAGAFAAGGRLPLWAVLLAPIPITMLTDPFYFWAGRRYGRPLIGYLEKHDRRWHRRARRAESFFARWGLWTILLAYFLPVPNDLLYFGASSPWTSRARCCSSVCGCHWGSSSASRPRTSPTRWANTADASPSPLWS